MKAVAKQVRMSPRKVRLVADTIRGLSIDEALLVLSSMQKRAAMPVIKTIESAVANASINDGIEKSGLTIASITVDEGQAMKRFHPSSRGRVHPYKKKGSHIKVVLKENTAGKQSAAGVADGKNKDETADKNDKKVEKKEVKGGKK